MNTVRVNHSSLDCVTEQIHSNELDMSFVTKLKIRLVLHAEV